MWRTRIIVQDYWLKQPWEIPWGRDHFMKYWASEKQSPETCRYMRKLAIMLATYSKEEKNELIYINDILTITFILGFPGRSHWYMGNKGRTSRNVSIQICPVIAVITFSIKYNFLYWRKSNFFSWMNIIILISKVIFHITILKNLKLKLWKKFTQKWALITYLTCFTIL